jgi:hypothetical protein
VAALSYDERDALILSLKQQGYTLGQISRAVGLGTSRIGQILQGCGGATDRWCCPACGDLVTKLGESGWCADCDEREVHYERYHAKQSWRSLFGVVPDRLDLSELFG